MKVKRRLTPIEPVWQMQLWLILASIQEDSYDGWVVNTLASIVTHTRPLAVKGHVSTNDYKQMKRILLDGCPAQLNFEEPLSNKIEMIDQGNLKSFNANNPSR